MLAAVNNRSRENVSLSSMSALAHRSPFNLHRHFRALVGETPKAYTSRVRLARAAAELLSTDRLTSLVGYAHGFGSHEVFTRAFNRHFGLSPRRYRARGLHVGDGPAAAIHATAVGAAAPCVGLYRLTLTERTVVVPVHVAAEDLPPTHALVLRRRAPRDDVAATLAECLPAVFGYAQRHGVAMTGPPFARYLEISMGSLLIEGGVPVAAPHTVESGEEIEALTLPAGRAAVAIHRGPYDRLPATYQAIEEWISGKGLAAAGPPREVYLTDPGERPDPETWETQIIQPIT